MAKRKSSKPAKKAVAKAAKGKASKRTAAPRVPTPDEITAQIAALVAIKPTIRSRSLLGEDHHDAIDAQILVLERRLSDDDIDNLSAFEDEPGYHDVVESGEKWATNVRDAAVDAHRWMHGLKRDQNEPPVEGWRELVIE